MKVKIVCQRDYETKEVELLMNEESLLEVQGSVFERDTLGYISYCSSNRMYNKYEIKKFDRT
ncbi:hypothetical protein ACWO4B_003059 [Clostridium sporogenes]